MGVLFTILEVIKLYNLLQAIFSLARNLVLFCFILLTNNKYSLFLLSGSCEVEETREKVGKNWGSKLSPFKAHTVRKGLKGFF